LEIEITGIDPWVGIVSVIVWFSALNPVIPLNLQMKHKKKLLSAFA